MDLHAYNLTSAQQLLDNLPPYVLVPPQQRQPSLSAPAQEAVLAGAQAQPAVRPIVELLRGSDGTIGTEGQASLTEQLQRLGEQRSSGGVADTLTASAGLVGTGGGVASQHVSTGGVGGVMASPPPRLRTVTFSDETQGLEGPVRLAPQELYRQMQDTLKT